MAAHRDDRHNVTLWQRLCRFSLTRSRRSRLHLERFCAQFASDEYALVIHSVDFNHKRYFPNSYVVSSKKTQMADLYADACYSNLGEIESGSFGLAVCTGLMEHIPDPARFIADLHRILRPGGKLILTGSAVFPFHGAPDNFFHYTPHGFRHLFRNWSHFEVLRGSSRPFETIAILLQRINLQCDVFPPMRLVNEVLWRIVPAFDIFVLREYDNHHLRTDGAEGSMMPSTLYAVVVR